MADAGVAGQLARQVLASVRGQPGLFDEILGFRQGSADCNAWFNKTIWRESSEDQGRCIMYRNVGSWV